jgi:hypothetical protein
VRAIGRFLIRLVGYALVLGLTARAADALWQSRVVDGSIEMQIFHDIGINVLLIAPLVFALLGIGALRRVAIFAAAFLVGAAFTAPFICARIAGS